MSLCENYATITQEKGNTVLNLRLAKRKTAAAVAGIAIEVTGIQEKANEGIETLKKS